LKFLVDAQLPKSLSLLLQQSGHDSKHTLELPLKNKSTDLILIDICRKEQRILITKDKDFEDSFIIRKIPAKLILIKTGNIKNTVLLNIFGKSLKTIIKSISKYQFIELDTNGITARY
jgi:predicted nuclease of predicted toxin-antitoxin system